MEYTEEGGHTDRVAIYIAWNILEDLVRLRRAALLGYAFAAGEDEDHKLRWAAYDLRQAARALAAVQRHAGEEQYYDV